MDREQFNRWMKNHATKFTGIADWMNSFKGGEGGKIAKQEVVEGWFSVLADVRIDDAIWATEAMFRGDVAKPFGYEDHPATIRRYAFARASERRHSSKKYQNGERVFNCGECFDRGMVTIWNPALLAWAREAFKDGAVPAGGWLRWREDPRAESRKKGIAVSGVVACNCAAGAARAQAARDNNFDLLSYDPARHVLFDEFKMGDALDAVLDEKF